MSNNQLNSGMVFKRRFPLGYLFHINPFTRYFTGYYDSSPPSCGQLLFIFEILIEMHASHKSYLSVRPAGLEIYWHPGNSITVDWDEVIKLEKKRYLGIFRTDLLYVDRPVFAEGHKPIFLTKKIKEHFENQRLAIPLHFYHGWPNGRLHEEFNKYVPQIIDKSQ